MNIIRNLVTRKPEKAPTIYGTCTCGQPATTRARTQLAGGKWGPYRLLCKNCLPAWTRSPK